MLMAQPNFGMGVSPMQGGFMPPRMGPSTGGLVEMNVPMAQARMGAPMPPVAPGALPYGGPMMQQRQAPPELLQASLNAQRVAPNKLGFFDMLKRNPQTMQMGLQMMQGARQGMGMGQMLPLLAGLFGRR